MMADLSLRGSHEYWKNYDDPMIYRVIAFMETTEDWTFDGHPQLEAIFTELGAILKNLTSFELSKEDEFVSFCAHVKTSRILRLLQAIDNVEPGSASKLLMHAESSNHPDNQMAGLFLRRNIVFERLRLLARIFSTERLELTLGLLEQSHAF